MQQRRGSGIHALALCVALILVAAGIAAPRAAAAGRTIVKRDRVAFEANEGMPARTRQVRGRSRAAARVTPNDGSVTAERGSRAVRSSTDQVGVRNRNGGNSSILLHIQTTEIGHNVLMFGSIPAPGTWVTVSLGERR